MNPRNAPVLAPYMRWAKTRPAARFDLAGSNVLACSVEDLHGAREAIDLAGRNDNGYEPLLDAIAARYDVSPDRVTTAQGASGANFLVCAALLQPGDDVLVESPGYDPLRAAPRLLGASIAGFERRFDERYALSATRVARAMTPRTKLIVITSPHNPTGVVADAAALEAIGRMAAECGAHVLVDEVYMDAAGAPARPAATFGDVFISTSSLTKSYGLAGLRCGWVLSSPAIAERIRRARDVIDGSGSIVAERLSVLAFAQLDRLLSRARALLTANHALLLDFLQSRPELEWIEPGGGTVVFPRVRGMDDTRAFAERLLRDRHTAIVPGCFFGAPAHFRIGFNIEADRLAGGLEALGAELDTVRPGR
jgi:aspartate/methionine/tyrosine aminotransferase